MFYSAPKEKTPWEKDNPHCPTCGGESIDVLVQYEDGTLHNEFECIQCGKTVKAGAKPNKYRNQNYRRRESRFNTERNSRDSKRR